MDSPRFPIRLPPGRRRQLARVLGLVLGSGGLVLVAALRRVLAVARAAPDAPAAPPDWILVPGFRLTRGEVHRHFARRLERALALWRAYPDARLLVSGRAGDDQEPSEAHAGLELLIDAGLPPTVPVLLETDASDSLQNLQAARGLLPQQPGRVAIVSNRYHLARLGWLARGLGLDWELVAAEARWSWTWGRCWCLLREAGGLLATGGRAATRLDPRDLTP